MLPRGEPAVGVRVPGEGEQAAGGGAAYGVVAGDGEQEEEHLQFGGVESGRGEGGHHVVAGVAAFVGGEFAGVGEHFAEQGRGARVEGLAVGAEERLRGVVGVLVADDPYGPFQQQGPVGGRDAQQVGEVQQRILVGDGAHEVGGAVLGVLAGGGEQGAGAVAHPPGEGVDAGGG